MHRDISNILGKKLSGLINRDDSKKLERWMEYSSDNKKGYHAIKEFWDHVSYDREELDPKSKIKLLKYRIKQADKLASFKRTNLWWKVAASVLLVCSICTFSLLIVNKGKASITLSTQLGQRSEAVLSDGTKVWLNAGTKLYVEDFNNRERKVRLTGEAYFKVASNKYKPFKVLTKGVEVEVIGTEFNVSAYDQDETFKTSLVEGVVDVSVVSNKARKYRLKPGQSAIIDKNNYKVKLIKSTQEYGGNWRNGVLSFKNASFEKLVTIIQRYYNVEIQYSKEEFKDFHFTGKLDNVELYQVFEFINYTAPIKYEINKNKVKILKVRY